MLKRKISKFDNPINQLRLMIYVRIEAFEKKVKIGFEVSKLLNSIEM